MSTGATSGSGSTSAGSTGTSGSSGSTGAVDAGPTESLDFIGAVDTPGLPRSFAFNDVTGEVWLTSTAFDDAGNETGSYVSVVAPDSGVVTTLPIAGQFRGIALLSDLNKVYVGNGTTLAGDGGVFQGEIDVIDGVTHAASRLALMPDTSVSQYLTSSVATDHVYAGTSSYVMVIDGTTDTVIATQHPSNIGAPNAFLFDIQVDEPDSKLYFQAYDFNTFAPMAGSYDTSTFAVVEQFGGPDAGWVSMAQGIGLATDAGAAVAFGLGPSADTLQYMDPYLEILPNGHAANFQGTVEGYRGGGLNCGPYSFTGMTDINGNLTLRVQVTGRVAEIPFQDPCAPKGTLESLECWPKGNVNPAVTGDFRYDCLAKCSFTVPGGGIATDERYFEYALHLYATGLTGCP